MKKTFRILIPIILSVTIVLGVAWYLLIYDKDFTRDMLLQGARYFDSQGHYAVAAWFYDTAYEQSGDNDAVAIELANQHKADGNYTQAEAILSRAIEDGGGVNLYIELSKTYVEQDKLLDAVKLLNGITNQQTKAQIDAIRPAAPTANLEPGFYNQYVPVTITTLSGTLYVNTNGQYPSVKHDLYAEPITLVAGENALYAIAVADNGLVSPLAVLGYTVGGVIEEVHFSDSAFEESVRKILNVDSEKVLFTNDLWEITTFLVPENVTDYSDLRYLPYLQDLTIQNGPSGDLNVLSSLDDLQKLTVTNTSLSSEDMQVISGLKKLEHLTLQDCSLSSVSGLEKLTSLVYLNLSDNTIRNISSLSDLKQLKEVYLQHNVLTDLSILSGLPVLEKLDVSYNSLTSLLPLAELSNLTWLDASNNQISAISVVSTMENLTYLYLANNQISSIDSISNLSKLNEFNISNNAITDISVIARLKSIQVLVFSNNQVEELPDFEQDCSLISIDGSHNLIKSLKPLSGLKNLNVVMMDYNEKISSVDYLASCPKLVSVNVFGTKVKDASALTEQSIIVNFDPT